MADVQKMQKAWHSRKKANIAASSKNLQKKHN